jgi:hypothetical protein
LTSTVKSIRNDFNFWVAVVSLLIFRRSTGHGIDPDREAFIFAHLGGRPFTDSIETVGVEGGRVHVLLSPERRKSYFFASGNSLRDRLAITVHEAKDDGAISDRLYFYYPAMKEWHPMTEQEGDSGHGVFSPDGLSVAYIRGAKGRASLAGLWLFDIQSKKSTALIVDTHPIRWHSSPAWRPNSKQIGLLDRRRGEKGLTQQFVIFDLDLKREETMFSPAGAFCFSPDGTKVGLLTGEGIEVLSIASRERKVIAPWSQLQGRVYNGGGMSWSRYCGMLAIGLFEQKGKTSEIWTFPLDGPGSKRVYSSPGRILGLSFIER